jgi:hypothetical protein
VLFVKVLCPINLRDGVMHPNLIGIALATNIAFGTAHYLRKGQRGGETWIKNIP